MDDDFDFGHQSSTRRSINSRKHNQQTEDDSLDDILESFSATHNKPLPAPRKNSVEMNTRSPVRKSISPDNNNDPPQTISGWNDSSAPSTRTGRRRDAGASMDFNSQDLFSSTSKKVNGDNQREFDSNNEANEIPEIPDLDDNEVDPSEDMAFQVAEAPDVQVHQISTYKELDKEFFREKAFQFLEGNIDVSLLHCGLNTENQIAEEEDVIWEWTKLFTEVVSVLSVANEQNGSEADDGSLLSDEQKLKESDIFNTSASQPTKRERNIVF